MKFHKGSFVFWSIAILICMVLHLPALNQDFIRNKEFGIEEQYKTDLSTQNITIPMLADWTEENPSGVSQLNWDLATNTILQGKNFSFHCNELRCFDSLKWNGETVILHADCLQDITPAEAIKHYKTTRALDGDLQVSIQKIQGTDYRIMTDSDTYVLQLPDLYHAFAGIATENQIKILFLAEYQKNYQLQYMLKLAEISLENGECKIDSVENVPESLTAFLQKSIESIRIEGTYYEFDNAACILVDEELFLYDEKSVYKINLKDKSCKRIFSVKTSIPKQIKEQYPDISNTSIYGMGYDQGIFCLELLAEDGVGNNYFYVPFIEHPIVYCRGLEDVTTGYLLPNC